ncbi:DUF179 domain-containing protein [Candidatus Williamhamiltonella defendens]|uniref:UPF0301 protein HDEF_0602 n=2 Tax=Candidatus Williamhamiltonella defendens TaxID=138072 RepID=Y602_HAMD5|nr:YqgE/AlgH family protein [Candidatus Hamiltonella defensa]C4K450.1 RecName: Full=UPF0301 protein HDEF_0602 [Candidatus Hamiltonella defensa 5AT (Acyrthosiphon pisum)]ACQ67343.1 hypothetical protein HDEF_0602 [Candidatus Hamiltonella defensa 5AT (Acyrthosiphon pisum)]ATW22083.1 DUF179 domain-containing protein [Candidatus Hamiltonella defensa]ATW33972.1 DUF179 domain-containing protein [Candidatus Hamiltonella defensa]
MNLQHHFLIAMPLLQNTYFERSVIYVCEHNENGAMGLMINQPVARFTLERLLKKLNISSVHDAGHLNKPVMSGGPLSDDRGFILHSPQSGFNSSIHVSDDTMITTSKDILKTLGTKKQPKNIMVAVGYTGWQKGQLEQELIDNVWLTTKADTEILFNTLIPNRWYEAASKLGINIFHIAQQAGHA